MPINPITTEIFAIPLPQDGTGTPARPQGYLAHAMWQWCRDRGVNIQHLAMQFCLHADFDGLVMPGPYNRRQVDEAYEAATVQIDPEVWRAFRAEFGVGLEV